MITRSELGKRLKVTRNTVAKWMKQGKLPKPDVQITRRMVAWKEVTLRDAGINV